MSRASKREWLMRREKPADVSQREWDSVGVPEASDAEFSTAKPFKDVFPAVYDAWRRKEQQRD